MNSLITFLQGKKTYIMAACGALTVFAYFTGLVDLATANMLLGLFGFGGIAALSAKINRATV